HAALEKGRTVLVVTESRKLFAQIKAELPAHLINGGSANQFIYKNSLYLAMAQTLSKRREMVQNFAYYKDNLLIINDEAHLGTATNLLKQFPDAYLIGFTATPDFRFAKHLPDLYNAIVI